MFACMCGRGGGGVKALTNNKLINIIKSHAFSVQLHHYVISHKHLLIDDGATFRLSLCLHDSGGFVRTEQSDKGYLFISVTQTAQFCGPRQWQC